MEINDAGDVMLVLGFFEDGVNDVERVVDVGRKSADNLAEKGDDLDIAERCAGDFVAAAGGAGFVVGWADDGFGRVFEPGVDFGAMEGPIAASEEVDAGFHHGFSVADLHAFAVAEISPWAMTKSTLCSALSLGS